MRIARQREDDFRSLSRLRRRMDFPAVRLDDTSGDGQSQSARSRFRRIERLKNACQLLVVHSRAVISNPNGHGRLPLNFRRIAAHLDVAPSRRSRPCIFENVVDDLLNPLSVAAGPQRATIVRDVQVHAVVALHAAQRLPRFNDDFPDVRRCHLQGERCGIPADLFIQALEIAEGLLCVVDQFHVLRMVGQIEFQQLQARAAALQGISAAVGQTADDLIDGRQALGLVHR